MGKKNKKKKQTKKRKKETKKQQHKNMTFVIARTQTSDPQTCLQWDRAYGKDQSHVGNSSLGQRGLLWDIKDF